MAILKQAEGGVPVSDLCREHGKSSAGFYKWRARFGGMGASLISEMKDMVEENRRLKRMYAEMSMQNDLLKEVLGQGRLDKFPELIAEDQEAVRQLVVAAFNLTQKRHKSTIFREVETNFWAGDAFPKKYTGYFGILAHQRTQRRRISQRKLIRYPELRQQMAIRLKNGRAPEQNRNRVICERAKQRVCRETKAFGSGAAGI